jgi:hypothetical protein
MGVPMPATQNAPQGALSTTDLIIWLGQIAEDRELPLISMRAAVKLAPSLQRGSTTIGYGGFSVQLGVSRNTCIRALTALRDGGYLVAAQRVGMAPTYTPKLRGTI